MSTIIKKAKIKVCPSRLDQSEIDYRGLHELVVARLFLDQITKEFRKVDMSSVFIFAENSNREFSEDDLKNQVIFVFKNAVNGSKLQVYTSTEHYKYFDSEYFNRFNQRQSNFGLKGRLIALINSTDRIRPDIIIHGGRGNVNTQVLVCEIKLNAFDINDIYKLIFLQIYGDFKLGLFIWCGNLNHVHHALSNLDEIVLSNIYSVLDTTILVNISEYGLTFFSLRELTEH